MEAQQISRIRLNWPKLRSNIRISFKLDFYWPLMIDDMMIVKVVKKSENIENRKRKAMFVSVSPQNAKQAKNPQNAENQELSGQKWPNFLIATRQGP